MGRDFLLRQTKGRLVVLTRQRQAALVVKRGALRWGGRGAYGTWSVQSARSRRCQVGRPHFPASFTEWSRAQRRHKAC